MGRNMDKKKKDFSIIIKEIRKQLDFSQEDLARELGVSFAVINRWENGQTSPSRLAMKQFNDFIGEMTENGKLTLGEMK
ncbi:MAG: helix-turn-helix transcriptional regulator [Spirochaetales bacterium]|nr:helix-turn-helix transcriptional regulator [Spirochaetales bacterium]